ncbi:MAG: thioredoxin family protein [Planctomycetes bacterium]|nr:thioredoxin family protein [Planctomycetota bacterium]
MKQLLTVALALVAALATAPASAEEPAALPWLTDITRAKEQAQKEKKDLFVLITGSDWCIWCKRLEGEVFSKPEFIEKVANDYVYLFLDFPNSEEAKAKVVDMKASEKLRDSYGAAGYPTVILATPEGLPYARTGYQPNGPQAYLTHLTELKANKETIGKMLAAEKAEKPDVALFVKGVGQLAKDDFLGYEGYGPILKKARTLDPEGKHGILPKILGAEEKKGLMDLVEKIFPEPGPNSSPPTAEHWSQIYEYMTKSKNLAGMEFCNLAFGCSMSLIEQKKFAEAKGLLERIAKDEMLKEEPQAQKAIAAKVQECEDGMKGGETAKPETPKPAEPVGG